VLGDSYVEAFQVEIDSTFLALTGRRLSHHTDIEVELMNFGRMGTTQTEQYLVLQNDAIRFSPDMAVLFFTPVNDLADVDKNTAVNDLSPFYRVTEDDELILDTSFTRRRQYKLKTYINPIKQRSAFVSLLMERYNQIRWSLRASGDPLASPSAADLQHR